MPNFATPSALVDTATKCFATAASLPSCATSESRAAFALVIVSSVVNVFDETMNSVSRRVEAARGLGQVGGVDVRDEAQVEVALAVVAQRLVRHHRAEVGAADADVDHVADALAGVAAPRAVAHPVGERGHAVEHVVHAGHHVDAVHHDRLASRGAQRHVQHGAVLGGVDPLAAEHRVDLLAHAAFVRQFESSCIVSSVTRFFE